MNHVKGKVNDRGKKRADRSLTVCASLNAKLCEKGTGGAAEREGGRVGKDEKTEREGRERWKGTNPVCIFTFFLE